MNRAGWAALIGLLALAGAAYAASEIRQYVVAGGAMGGSATVHRVRSTLGQSVVANATGATHSMRSGFWRGSPFTSAAPEGALDLPVAFLLHPAFPNPSRGDVSIAYDVPRAGGRVAVHVYDVRGRLVRTLRDESESPGRKSLTWDRRDDAGRAMGAGVFAVKMVAPGYSASRKVITLP